MLNHGEGPKHFLLCTEIKLNKRKKKKRKKEKKTLPRDLYFLPFFDLICFFRFQRLRAVHHPKAYKNRTWMYYLSLAYEDWTRSCTEAKGKVLSIFGAALSLSRLSL